MNLSFCFLFFFALLGLKFSVAETSYTIREQVMSEKLSAEELKEWRQDVFFARKYKKH